MLNRVNHQVLKFKKSGIRKFAEAAAKIDGVVSLTIGEPEFDTELNIKNAAKKALDDNYTHYPSGQGILQLRQAIADFESKSNAMHYTADEVIVTNGSTEGLASTFLALLTEGDEVVIPAPMYNKPANWNEFRFVRSNLLSGVAIPNSNPDSNPAIIAVLFIFR